MARFPKLVSDLVILLLVVFLAGSVISLLDIRGVWDEQYWLLQKELHPGMSTQQVANLMLSKGNIQIERNYPYVCQFATGQTGLAEKWVLTSNLRIWRASVGLCYDSRGELVNMGDPDS